jgi:hypothetical protein
MTVAHLEIVGFKTRFMSKKQQLKLQLSIGIFVQTVLFSLLETRTILERNHFIFHLVKPSLLTTK